MSKAHEARTGFSRPDGFRQGGPKQTMTPRSLKLTALSHHRTLRANGSHSLPLRQDAGYVLSSFLLRLAFDVERLIFSTPRAQGRHPDHMSGDEIGRASCRERV